MCIVHRMTLRARQRRSAQLGQCLARLDGVGIDGSGCLELRIFPLAGDALGWQVEGRWRSVAAPFSPAKPCAACWPRPSAQT
jgi:hypothetical protein